MTAFAVGIWVYEQTGDVTPLTLAATFAVIPAIFTTGFAGVITDRWDRRYLMILADLGQAVATLLLLISIGTDSFQLWHLYVVSAVEAIFGSFQFPAFMASVTMLIPDKHRDRANALQQLTGPISGIIAPIIAALILSAVNVTGVMAIDLITFLVAVGVVLTVHIPRPAETAEGAAAKKESIWKEMAVGFQYLWSKRTLFFFAIYGTLINYPMRIIMILVTPYILSRTDSKVWLGTLSGVMSTGALIGGIIFSIRGGAKSRIKTMVFALIIMGIFVTFYGLGRTPIVLGIAIFLAMLPISAVDASLFSLLQVKIPPDLQGRVFSVIFQMVMLLRPAAFITAGLLADHVFETAVGTSSWDVFAPFVGNEAGAGMGLLIALSGISIVVMTAIFYAIPSMRHLEENLPNYEAIAEEDLVVTEMPEIDSGILGEGATAPAS
jgi:MFS family permease